MVWRVEGGIHDTSMRKHGRCFWPQQRPTLSSNWISNYFSSPANCEVKVLAEFWLSLNLQSMPLSWLQWSYINHLFLAPWRAFRPFLPSTCSETPYTQAPHSSHLFSSLTCFNVLFFPGLDVVTWFWNICFWTDLKVLRIPLLRTAPKFCFLLVTQSHLTLTLISGPRYAIV